MRGRPDYSHFSSAYRLTSVSQTPSTDNFSSHVVYGENAPKRLIFGLMAAGVLLAGLALWLSQDSIFQAPEPMVENVSAPIISSPAVNAASSITPQEAIIQSTVQMQPESAPVLVSDNRPICPGILTFYFSTGATAPIAEDVRVGLDTLVDWTRQHPSAKLSLEGHADVVGVDEYNLMLSYQRAKAVASMLEKSGVARQQVQISAMGSDGLISGIPGDAQGNRRVNVQLLDPDECRSEPN